MHILFSIANDSYVPYFNWFARKSLDFPQIKISFLCFYKEEPRMLKDMKPYGCDVFWIKYDDSKRKRGLLLCLPKVLQLLCKIKPDVVHAHLFDDALMLLTVAKLIGIKFRGITKGDACYHYFYTPQWMIFDRLNNFCATHIIAVSEENRKFIIRKEKAAIEKLHMIHHGIPSADYLKRSPKKIKDFRIRYNLDGFFVYGSIGRLELNKGMIDVVKAAIKLEKKTNIKYKFLIAGEGAQKAAINKLIEEEKLHDKIILLGWVDEEDIPSLYANLDVYVHASHFETFGFVIAEAMMCGLPVIATKSSGAARDAIEHKKMAFYLIMEI